jgi:hypothetical protein
VSEQIPNADQAVIAPEKLRDYLLSPAHPVGRFKAAFFAQLGYAQADWQTLAADLRSQHLSLPPEAGEATPFGRKYLIRGALTGPAGRRATVVSVWIVRSGEDVPRLVTVYPEGT